MRYHQEGHGQRNVWFLGMGARESKTTSQNMDNRRSNPSNLTSTSGGRGRSSRSTNTRPPEPIPVWPENSVRWRRLYDVYICHSEVAADTSYAVEMLSYLEEQPERLRCFLPLRDMEAGSPVSTEMCHGAQNSHCWVMLLTPHFLSDNWCKYQMHQFLTQAPCADGRLIPVMMGMSFSQYPAELRHMFAFKGALSDKSVFGQVKRAILTYLKKLLTDTTDPIPSVPARSITSENSQSASGTSSHMTSSGTRESTSDMSTRNSTIQESTSDMSTRNSTTRESTSDMSIRSSTTQESTSDMSCGTELHTKSGNEMSLTHRCSIGQSVTHELSTDINCKSKNVSIKTKTRTCENPESEITSSAQERTCDIQESSNSLQDNNPDLAGSLTVSNTAETCSVCSGVQTASTDPHSRSSAQSVNLHGLWGDIHTSHRENQDSYPSHSNLYTSCSNSE
ncbi:toll/interleukin-1 receptor domain-containing adapter protein isoform X2 [Mixophyes fleayi]